MVCAPVFRIKLLMSLSGNNSAWERKKSKLTNVLCTSFTAVSNERDLGKLNALNMSVWKQVASVGKAYISNEKICKTIYAKKKKKFNEDTTFYTLTISLKMFYRATWNEPNFTNSENCVIQLRSSFNYCTSRRVIKMHILSSLSKFGFARTISLRFILIGFQKFNYIQIQLYTTWFKWSRFL